MSALLAGMNHTAAMGLAALLNTLWYAAGVVGLTWLVLRYMPRVNAATRHWIWTAVLGFLLILPFLPGLVAQARTILAARAQATAAIKPLATVPMPLGSIQPSAPLMLTVNTVPGSTPWPLWLLAAWIIAAGWQWTRLMRGVASVRRLKARAEVVPIGVLPIHLRRRVRRLESSEVASPVAVGYRHPAIVVPPGLLKQLGESESRDVLLHELAHLMRYDDGMALFTGALGALLALHPLAPIVLGQIEREREMACDDFVVAHTGSAWGYARSLARLHDLRWTTGTRLLAPGILGRNSSLGDRIESLLRRGREFSARPSLASLGVSALLLALLLGAGGLVPGWIAIAQTNTASPTSFEVASIRPGNADNHRRTDLSITGDRFSTTNFPLGGLIEFAYHIKPEQLEGLPSWAKKRKYTIQAVPPPDTPHVLGLERSQMVQQMVRSLLTDRFKLRVHRTTKKLPVYEIIVAKHGPKLKPMNRADFTKAGETYHPGDRSIYWGDGRINALGASVSRLADMLSRYLGRTVIDKTGLTGRYDFNLTWTPWRAGMGGAGFNQKSGLTTATSSGPSIFTAIQQQLGLKLKPAKGPVEVLVVDHVEPPTPN